MTAVTRKGRQTDEAFRDAARLVFARDGYLNAKISDIAAAAGRSVASFYNYYDTKADLLIALAEEFHAEATQLAVLPYRVGLAGEEALREAVAGFWRTYAKRRGELIGIFQAAMIEGSRKYLPPPGMRRCATAGFASRGWRSRLRSGRRPGPARPRVPAGSDRP